MSTRAQTFELLTPCFCAGISKSRPEMRIASIRGQLRWWARVLYGTGSYEYAFFGGIHGKGLKIPGKPVQYPEEGVASSFKLSLGSSAANKAASDSWLLPHKAPQNIGFLAKALPADSQFTLEWTPQLHPGFRDKPDDLLAGQSRADRLEKIIRAWLMLGGLGRRMTRAAGAVWPLGYMPAVATFADALADLAIGGDKMKIAVLNKVHEDAEALRDVADRTVHGLHRDDISGNPLGYVDRWERKASPLRFKIGRFADGFRLIAIWDKRNDRGGSMTECLAALRAGFGKELGDLLLAAGF